MRPVDAILARFPGPVTLYPSRFRPFAGFVLSLCAAAFSAWLVSSRHVFGGYDTMMAWFSTVVFGFGAARFTILLLPGAMSLTLGTDGFEIHRMPQRNHYAWQDVSGFRVHQTDDIWKGKIVFDVLTAGAGRQHRGAATVTRLLPGDYPLPTDDLIWLMKQWGQRTLTREK